MFNAPWTTVLDLYPFEKRKKGKKKTSGGQTEFHWSNSIPIFDAWTKAAAFRVVSPFCGQQGGGDTNTSTTNLRRGHEAWRCLTRNTVKGLDGEKRGEAKNKMFQDIKDSSRIGTVKFTNLPLRDFQRRSHPPLAFSRPLLVPPRHNENAFLRFRHTSVNPSPTVLNIFIFSYISLSLSRLSSNQ